MRGRASRCCTQLPLALQPVRTPVFRKQPPVEAPHHLAFAGLVLSGCILLYLPRKQAETDLHRFGAASLCLIQRLFDAGLRLSTPAFYSVPARISIRPQSNFAPLMADMQGDQV